MTPIKCFVLDGLKIYTKDWADKLELQCTAESEEKAVWLIQCLSLHHDRPWDDADVKATRPSLGSNIGEPQAEKF